MQNHIPGARLNHVGCQQTRVFKTEWFSRVARDNAITDSELCHAAEAIRQGKTDYLGGGVLKKRLSQNRVRAIILAKGGHYLLYTCLFAKQDKSGLDPQELAALRELAKHYSVLADAKVNAMIANNELVEICHE